MLMRINILELENGTCLFEKIWKWSGISSSEGICNLVCIFTQISREIGEKGDVGQTLFEQTLSDFVRPRASTVAPSILGGSNSRKYLSLKNKNFKNSDGPKTVRLTLDRIDNIAVAVFHDSEDDKNLVAEFARAVKDKFTSMYEKGSDLRTLVPSKDPNDASNVESNLDKYAKFNLYVAEQKSVFERKQLVVDNRQQASAKLSKEAIQKNELDIDMRKKIDDSKAEINRSLIEGAMDDT